MIKNDEIAAQNCGLNILRIKVAAFGLAGLPLEPDSGLHHRMGHPHQPLHHLPGVSELQYVEDLPAGDPRGDRSFPVVPAVPYRGAGAGLIPCAYRKEAFAWLY